MGFKCNLTPLQATNDVFKVDTYLDPNNNKYN